MMMWNFTNTTFKCRYDQLDAPGRALAFSPDSQYLLIGSQDQANNSGQLILLDAKTCEPVRRFASTYAVSSIAFNTDGSRAITGMGYQGKVILWDVASGNEISHYLYSNYGPTLPVAFSPDGSHILSAGPADLFLVDVATGDTARSYPGLGESPSSISISPDGRYVVSASRDGNIIVWDYTTGEVRHRINFHQAVIQVRFSPDSKVVYAITETRKLIEWPIAEQSLSEVLHWIDANRYVRQPTCLEKQQYHLVSPCQP
jgi:WD40 repeat protein